MVSISLLPSMHQNANIRGVTHGPKSNCELSQVYLKQLQSKQVNMHYIPAARERLRTIYRLCAGADGNLLIAQEVSVGT